MNSKEEQELRLSTESDDECKPPVASRKRRSQRKRRRKNTNHEETDPFKEPSPLIVNLNESNRPRSDDSDSDSLVLAAAFELHETKKINRQNQPKDDIILSKMKDRLAEELHQQELRHRDEIHALRKTQMEELYILKLEHERLETAVANKKRGKNGRRLENKVA